MRNVNRAAKAASHAVEDDREYRFCDGSGREGSRRRKVVARRAERRLRKAILAVEREEAR